MDMRFSILIGLRCFVKSWRCPHKDIFGLNSIVQRTLPNHIHLLGSVVLLHMGENKLFLCNIRALAVIISILLGLDNPLQILYD